ncbi:uncharacterized protein LOC115823773 [Chanos chanos]|uniref:Uncharacterized protein LOC115823773 n=1 Tax=Chanos chanos TaxID=29144 RepID=A0A6J2WDW1_CHACN|nr:uncharacterized protein LOC115823773 [Chanos chanos]
MSEALILAFQSQLSVVMETVLKSAMYEITRLVEDSFLEEVGRSKQEVELLKQRLQLSERKLKERERERGKTVTCADCSRTRVSGENVGDGPAGKLTGDDTLCLSLSLREPGEHDQPLNDKVWSSMQKQEALLHSATQAHKDEQRDARCEQTSGPHSATQDRLHVFQRHLSSAPDAGVHRETFCDSRVTQGDGSDACGVDSPYVTSMDLNSGQLQSGILYTSTSTPKIASPSLCPAVKSESKEPVAVKEEEEMIPVCNDLLTDDEAPPDMFGIPHGDFRGPWNQEETQIGQKDPARYSAAEQGKRYTKTNQRTFSAVAREILTQFQVWQKACYSRNIEWGPITAKIISALPHLSGMEAEVIVRCTKMLHNRRDYLRRRAKVNAFLKWFPLCLTKQEIMYW